MTSEPERGDGVRRYRRRLPECRAIFYDGTNGQQVADWCHGRIELDKDSTEPVVLIALRSSVMKARPGWFVVEEAVPGETPRYYPVKGEFFTYTHEEVKEEPPA